MDKSKESKGALITQDEIKGKKNALDKMAARLDVSAEVLKKTLMATAFSLCKDEAQFLSAVIVANTYQLNPILKEMTAFPGKSGGVVPIVMIDGWIKLVNRQDNYDGVELIENENKDGEKNNSKTTLDSVTAKFYLKGREHAVVITEYMDECYDGTKGPWQKWPRRMLRHKAYIQGARVAFGFTGIYDEDEAARIREGEAIEAVAEPMIGLKHDKAGKDTAGAAVAQPASGQPTEQAAPGAVVEGQIVPAWDDFGDPDRFGSQGKPMLSNLKKCADKLGQEKFVAILGREGWGSAKEIVKVPDLAKVVNALLNEIADGCSDK